MNRVRVRHGLLLALALIAAALASGCAPSAGAPTACGQSCRTEAADSITAAAGTAAAQPPAPPSPIPGPTEAPAGASITVSAVGDVSLARELVQRMELHGGGYPYGLIAPLLTGDIVFGNLEGALTERGEPWPKSYNFRTPPRFASGLRDAGFDIVSLANNHTMDYGRIGLEDTIAELDAMGVRRPGAGAYRAQAWDPAIIQMNGLSVAFVACVLTPDEGSGFTIDQWQARAGDAPGVAVCEQDALRSAIAAGRELADFVIVAVHAGDEYVNAPNATQRQLAETSLAAGVDAYIGAHAHVVQPVEQRGNQLIAWGLGNFIFDLDEVDLANIPEPRVSLVLNVTLTKGAGVTSWEAVPVVLDASEDRPRPATATEADVLFDLLAP